MQPLQLEWLSGELVDALLQLTYVCSIGGGCEQIMQGTQMVFIWCLYSTTCPCINLSTSIVADFVSISVTWTSTYTLSCVQVAWQNGLTDLAMPFMIQFMKDYVGKVDTLMADRKDNMEARKVGLLSCPTLHHHAAKG